MRLLRDANAKDETRSVTGGAGGDRNGQVK
jgi:hypothetical protein